MANDKPTHTIIGQSKIITDLSPSMTIRLVKSSDGSFTFHFCKSPFSVWLQSSEWCQTESEIKDAVSIFARKTREREPYLLIAIQGLSGEDIPVQ